MHTMKTIVMGILCIAAAGAFGKTIYLKVDATITAVKNFELYGGFKGDETGTEEEMLAARDWDEYQTIFTGDKGGDDMWVHIVPDKNDLSAPAYITTDEPVIRDGKVNLPAYTGDYDAYVISLPGAAAIARSARSSARRSA